VSDEAIASRRGAVARRAAHEVARRRIARRQGVRMGAAYTAVRAPAQNRLWTSAPAGRGVARGGPGAGAESVEGLLRRLADDRLRVAGGEGEEVGLRLRAADLADGVGDLDDEGGIASDARVDEGRDRLRIADRHQPADRAELHVAV